MRFTKGTYKFNRNELWNLDIALSKVIADGLIQFRDMKKHGVPSEFCIENDDINLTISNQNWIDCINKMIYAFENDEPEVPNGIFNNWFEEVDENDISYVNGVKLTKCNIKVINQPLYDAYKEKQRIHEEKVQEGLELFAKYFKNLWD